MSHPFSYLLGSYGLRCWRLHFLNLGTWGLVTIPLSVMFPPTVYKYTDSQVGAEISNQISAVVQI